MRATLFCRAIYCTKPNPDAGPQYGWENNFTSDDMISKFEAFTNHKLYTLYQTEINKIEWIQMIDEYWDE